MTITNKTQMYRLLASGQLGNTTPQFFSLSDWLQSAEYHRYQSWGVRTLTPAGPCRLFCPRAEVLTTVQQYQGEGHQVNISPMIDAVVNVTLWADVYDSDEGLLVYGIEYPPKGASWRQLMPSQGKTWRGVQAHMILRKHLNPSSLADLEALRDRYPGHVYELSACEKPFGVIPNRNAVLWETRLY